MYPHQTRFGLNFMFVLVVFMMTLMWVTNVSAQSRTPEKSMTPIFLPVISNAQGPTEQIHKPDEYMIIEGDIQVPLDYFAAQTGSANSTNGTFTTMFWSGGIVNYEFDANVSTTNRQIAVAAMGLWQNAATVTFQQCAQNSCTGNYVHIQDSTVNNSAVGMQGGRQVINITSWGNQFIIAHELAHTLGFWHEQSRPDRSSYIQINLQNVCKATDTQCNGGFCLDNQNVRIDCDFNFNIQNNARKYGAYDFDSLMHYGRTDFSRNGSDTITVLSPNQSWQSTIGQRNRLSKMDALLMSFLYPQPNWRFVDINMVTVLQLGSFLNPMPTIGGGVIATPAAGTLWVQPGNYNAAGTYNKSMTIRAPLGDVVLR